MALFRPKIGGEKEMHILSEDIRVFVRLMSSVRDEQKEAVAYQASTKQDNDNRAWLTWNRLNIPRVCSVDDWIISGRIKKNAEKHSSSRQSLETSLNA